jgi:hypothetical protein
MKKEMLMVCSKLGRVGKMGRKSKSEIPERRTDSEDIDKIRIIIY